MELEERLKTHWQEYQAKGKQEGARDAKAQVLELLKQGYTVEQLTARLSADLGSQTGQQPVVR